MGITHENNALKQEMMELKETNKTLKANNIKLNQDNEEYKDTMESMNRYDLGNMNVMNEVKLKELEDKMNENLQKLRRRREQLLAQEKDKSLCILCYENKKCILIQGCNHLDICERCKNKLEPKKCPRCQETFKKTIKVNHLNV